MNLVVNKIQAGVIVDSDDDDNDDDYHKILDDILMLPLMMWIFNRREST